MPRKLILGNDEIVDGTQLMWFAALFGYPRHMFRKIQMSNILPLNVPSTTDHQRSIKHVQLLKC